MAARYGTPPAPGHAEAALRAGGHYDFTLLGRTKVPGLGTALLYEIRDRGERYQATIGRFRGGDRVHIRVLQGARKNPFLLKGHAEWGPSEHTWEDTWAWYKRNKLSGRHPKIVLPKVTEKWLMRRLPQAGFVPGKVLGTGCLGVVFSLLDLNERPTGYVGKITKDPAEVAAVHRIQDAGLGHLSIFPKILGGWQVPGGRWLIIREGLPGGCIEGWNDYPTPAWVSTYKDAGLCLFMLYAEDVYAPPDEEEQEELARAWKLLTAEERQMITTLYSGLKQAAKAGIYFGDLNSRNIRFRHHPDGSRDLVVSDFGMNVGPAVRVPIARNPRRRRS